MIEPLAVVPILVGPLQVLLTLLPAVLLALASALLASLKPSALKNLARVLWQQKVQVLVVVTLMIAMAWGGRWALSKLRSAAGAREAGEQDWPMARGTLARRGAAELAEGPNGGGLNWSWKQGSEAFFSSPTLIGNRVYVASAVFGAFSSSGQIYCFDADTGAIAWKGGPPGYRPTFSSPVISGNYLVCGEGLHTTRNARVICLDLRSGHEGETLWTFATSSHVECTPVIYEGRVYVGAGDDGYYCLELEPETTGNARVVWHVPGEKYVDAETSLAVHEGKVYAGLGVGGKALCVLDAANGNELRRLPMPYPVFSPPAIADGKLYLGLGNGDFANSAAKLLEAEIQKLIGEGKGEAEIAAAKRSLASEGEVRCIDLATLKTDWTFATRDTVLGSIAVAGDRLYFGSRDRHVYALSRDGQPQGKWNSRAGIVASPAVTEKHVYVVNEGGMLFALDRNTFEPVWEYRLGAATSLVGTPPLFISSPVAGRGRIYVGTQYDGFLCAGSASKESLTQLWPGPLGGPGIGGCLDSSPLPELGEIGWSYPMDAPKQSAEPLVQAPVAVQDGNLLVPIAKGPLRGLVCLPLREAKSVPATRWQYKLGSGVHSSPAAVGDRVFVVNGKPGEKGRELAALALDSGNVLWQAGVAPQASGVFSAGDDAIWIQSAPGKLAALSLEAKLLWNVPVGEIAHAPASTPALLVVAAANPPALVALDRPTGSELWRIPLASAPVSSPAVRGSTIYLGTVAGVEARSIIDGLPLGSWQISGGPATGDFALTRTRLLYVNKSGELIVLHLADGTVERKVEGVVPGTTPLVSRDAVLLVAETQLLRLALEQPDVDAAEWLDLTPLGRMTSPPILHDGGLYFGASPRGLVQAGEVASE